MLHRGAAEPVASAVAAKGMSAKGKAAAAAAAPAGVAGGTEDATTATRDAGSGRDNAQAEREESGHPGAAEGMSAKGKAATRRGRARGRGRGHSHRGHAAREARQGFQCGIHWG